MLSPFACHDCDLPLRFAGLCQACAAQRRDEIYEWEQRYGLDDKSERKEREREDEERYAT